MSATDVSLPAAFAGAIDQPPADETTVRAIERGSIRRSHRSLLVRLALPAADAAAIALAFVAATAIGGPATGLWTQTAVFLATLPLWLALAAWHGLYRHDRDRPDHSTVDEFPAVLHTISLGTLVVGCSAWLTGLSDPAALRITAFAGLAVAAVMIGRVAVRPFVRRSNASVQNTVIIGAGEVGQLLARKLLSHPEYGLNLVGFVDAQPRTRREDIGDLTVLGAPDRLPDIVSSLAVDRAIVAFSNESHAETVATIRSLERLGVRVDIVPRLFDAVPARVDVHRIEGLPLVGLPALRPSRVSFAAKRGLDIVGALVGLALAAPLFAVVALLIKREDGGPVFFRQTRLGGGMKEFTLLKFRTMWVGTRDDEHREFIRQTMSSRALKQANGLYKLERTKDITVIGRWLRRTSVDELPQLINVLRGHMSLVGPRPCLPYETENFEPHQFERFLVPAGITGLWQVTARAHATFGEALDLDVAYARGWTLGLDLRLLCRTPVQLARREGTR